MKPRYLRPLSGPLVRQVPGRASAQRVTPTAVNMRNEGGQSVLLIFEGAEPFDPFALDWAIGCALVPPPRCQGDCGISVLTSAQYAGFVFDDENADCDATSDGERVLESVWSTDAPDPKGMSGIDPASVWPGPTTVTLHYGQK